MVKALTCIIHCIVSIVVAAALNPAFAGQPSSQQAAGQVQKSLEDLEEYGRLEEKIEKGQKAYIENIVVKGVTLLDSGEVNSLIEPYFRHWLTSKDIQQLIDSLKELYRKKPHQALPQVSYRIEGYKLIIEAKE